MKSRFINFCDGQTNELHSHHILLSISTYLLLKNEKIFINAKQ